MKKFNVLDWISFTLTTIGALNWGLIGLDSRWNIVNIIFGDNSSFERIAYILIGLGALWLLYAITRILVSEK